RPTAFPQLYLSTDGPLPLELAGLRCERRRIRHAQAKFDVALVVEFAATGVCGTLHHHPAVLAPASAERLVAAFLARLRELVGGAPAPRPVRTAGASAAPAAADPPPVPARPPPSRSPPPPPPPPRRDSARHGQRRPRRGQPMASGQAARPRRHRAQPRKEYGRRCNAMEKGVFVLWGRCLGGRGAGYGL